MDISPKVKKYLDYVVKSILNDTRIKRQPASKYLSDKIDVFGNPYRLNIVTPFCDYLNTSVMYIQRHGFHYYIYSMYGVDVSNELYKKYCFDTYCDGVTEMIKRDEEIEGVF